AGDDGYLTRQVENAHASAPKLRGCQRAVAAVVILMVRYLHVVCGFRRYNSAPLRLASSRGASIGAGCKVDRSQVRTSSSSEARCTRSCALIDQNPLQTTQ